MTLDTYGHLFPSADDGREMERSSGSGSLLINVPALHNQVKAGNGEQFILTVARGAIGTYANSCCTHTAGELHTKRFRFSAGN